MNSIIAPGIALGLFLFPVVGSSAGPAQIELKSAHYATFVARGELSGRPFETRTNYSSTPLTDAFTSRDPLRPVMCQADATLFKVATLADAAQHRIYRGYSEAFASTEFVFAPVADTLTSIQLNFSMGGQCAWGGNEISLFDLTTATLLWRYHYQGIGGGNIPWVFDYSLNGATASLSLATELFSSHDYRFKLSNWGSSSVPDCDTRLTWVSGLVVVPEPSALALVILGALFCASKKRR